MSRAIEKDLAHFTQNYTVFVPKLFFNTLRAYNGFDVHDASIIQVGYPNEQPGSLGR